MSARDDYPLSGGDFATDAVFIPRPTYNEAMAEIDRLRAELQSRVTAEAWNTRLS